MAKNKQHTVKLYDEWEKRWEGEDDQKKITALGRLMFKKKRSKMRQVLTPLKAHTAIDVGCALGHTLEVLSDLGLDCIGIDVTENAVAACLRKNLPAKLQDVENVQDKFDIVFSDGMLEHFLHFEPFVGNFCRISNKYVVIIQPNHESLVGKTLVYLAEILRGSTNIFEYNYRISDFISVFSKFNFYIHSDHPIFFDVFRVLVFEKSRTASQVGHTTS